MPGGELYLVRHGQSASNVEQRLCGEPPGPALTALGRRQAEAVAVGLLRTAARPIRIVSSPLLRAWQTADALARKIGRPPAIEVALRETRFGVWEGRTSAELRDDPAYRAWQKDPEDGAPRHVERVSKAGARAGAALSALVAGDVEGTLVAFTHQHVLLGFVRLCGLAEAEEDWFPNAVVVHARRERDEWRILAVDRTAVGGNVLRPEGAAARA